MSPHTRSRKFSEAIDTTRVIGRSSTMLDAFQRDCAFAFAFAHRRCRWICSVFAVDDVAPTRSRARRCERGSDDTRRARHHDSEVIRREARTSRPSCVEL
jgi:hypothetical protein